MVTSGESPGKTAADLANDRTADGTALGGEHDVRRPPAGRTVLGWLTWLVLAVLALLALGRLTHLDDALAYPYSVVNALTPLVYLPAYAAAAVGFGLRRNLLMLAAVPLIGLHLFWTVPELWPSSPDDVPAGAVSVRLLAANLQYSNARAQDLAPQIAAQHPDIVVLEEVSPLTFAGIDGSGALKPYPYRVVHQDLGAFGYAVFSRFPLSAVRAPVVGGEPMARMTVTVGDGQRFELFAVHTISPTTTAYTKRWRAQLDQLAADVRSSPLPVVLAGDFNATRDHRPFRHLLDSGVRDAHDVTGAGWQPTWPADLTLPPVIRIDHVLASPAFAITGYHRGGNDGSDHLPVIANLALRRP
ncbi:Endonuclease/exonuclease/phosphatase [Pseudofrankia inefficax]|uniref:Endonuclease/exonuclease/phosphatase n=1 Tax=Pseudofrankia inefficax (strain DSM 45817 / CECT 9037 / DDB 130130 / EuI1c) TaxID=298654 RepID=E3IYS0_PSEI1|nr:endonuclease/exonuclease/phosphatase family protein [Pseudofrankia inefficax]ADP79058.1 Endonuclease/exonuclease/phosphatase [Pseudofrankia inefficax]